MMNRKHNPLLSLAALALLLTILVLTCAGCETDTAEAAGAENTARFTVESSRTDGIGTCYIITDTETGVQYLYYRTGNGDGGLTVLQPGEE